MDSDPNDLAQGYDTINKWSERYADAWYIRALVNLLPGVGSSLDIILAARGDGIYRRRLEAFLDELQAVVNEIQLLRAIKADISSEEFMDLFNFCASASLKTRGSVKRRAFVNIIVNQAVKNIVWEQSEQASRILDSISELEMGILSCITADVNSQIRFFSVDGQGRIDHSVLYQQINLSQQFDASSIPMLRMACANLVRLGLAQEIGIAPGNMVGSGLYMVNQEAHWLVNWIKDFEE